MTKLEQLEKSLRKIHKKVCPTCRGLGKVEWASRYGGTYQETCRNCRGNQIIVDEQRVGESMVKYIESGGK